MSWRAYIDQWGRTALSNNLHRFQRTDKAFSQWMKTTLNCINNCHMFLQVHNIAFLWSFGRAMRVYQANCDHENTRLFFSVQISQKSAILEHWPCWLTLTLWPVKLTSIYCMSFDEFSFAQNGNHHRFALSALYMSITQNSLTDLLWLTGVCLLRTFVLNCPMTMSFPERQGFSFPIIWIYLEVILISFNWRQLSIEQNQIRNIIQWYQLLTVWTV